MKIVIFSHSQYSHFATTMRFSKLIKNHKVYFFYDDKFSTYLLDDTTNINFIQYPSEIKILFKSIKSEYSSINDGINTKRNIDSIDGMIDEAKTSYEFMLRCSDIYCNSLIDIIKDINPDFIFRDSCCLFGRLIGDLLNIPLIGFTTSSMILEDEGTYSKKSFLEKVFSYNLTEYSETDINYLYLSIINEFKILSEKYNVRCFPINYLFDPDEQYNFCFGLPFTNNYKTNYYYLRPFLFENKLEKPIKNRNSIYVSAGSTISFPLVVYNFILNIAKRNKYNFYLTFLYNDSPLIFKQLTIPNNVSISRYHKQMEILENSVLFITHGGFNSLLESIYYEVPLLVLPLCSDQFFDADFVQRKKIGLMCKHDMLSNSRDLEKYMDNIISNYSYIENIKQLKIEMSNLLKFSDFIYILERINYEKGKN